MGISVVIHTYNSEKYLEKCLKSVSSCEEIIVCDMYSTDMTIEIAKRYGAKVIYHKNVGFADPARNYALSYASQNWILVLDSDEEAPPALLKHLRKLMNDLPAHENGVFIPRKNLHLGEVLWFTYPNQILRFFKKDTVSFSEKVHCTPTIKKGGAHHISKKRKDLAIIHHNYDSIESFISRMNTYTTLELEKFEERGIKFSASLFFVRPTSEFLKRYLLKGGFKQGWYGFIFSLLYAFYKLVAAIKLWAKEFKSKQTSVKQVDNQIEMQKKL